ncbi:hypothetical protein QFZ80_005847 [Paenibacillus sp. V4I7]|nr:hypothetical protein [Paenibacillus sp.]MDQ0902019.1 hypothetical protein [Paenibacillus sp. V4I7]MDQ0919485.1 hypothetical protein [Paenibacillus sp. V4I5]
MRRYNFIRPLLIIAVAYLVNNIVANVCLMLGATKEAASNIGFAVMLIAVIITFIRLNKNKRKS